MTVTEATVVVEHVGFGPDAVAYQDGWDLQRATHERVVRAVVVVRLNDEEGDLAGRVGRHGVLAHGRRRHSHRRCAQPGYMAHVSHVSAGAYVAPQQNMQSGTHSQQCRSGTRSQQWRSGTRSHQCARGLAHGAAAPPSLSASRHASVHTGC